MPIDPITMEIALDFLSKKRYYLAEEKNFESHTAPMSIRVIDFLVKRIEKLEARLEENKDD